MAFGTPLPSVNKTVRSSLRSGWQPTTVTEGLGSPHLVLGKLLPERRWPKRVPGCGRITPRNHADLKDACRQQAAEMGNAASSPRPTPAHAVASIANRPAWRQRRTAPRRQAHAMAGSSLPCRCDLSEAKATGAATRTPRHAWACVVASQQHVLPQAPGAPMCALKAMQALPGGDEPTGGHALFTELRS